MAKTENDVRLDVITKAIEKEYGHVVRWLGDAAEVKREYLSTGCLGLDNALCNGGLERGLIAEFFGGTGAGKSFLGYSIIKNACALGHKAAIVDAENSLDPSLLLKLGLPPKDVVLAEGAPTGEANLAIADRLMSSGNFAVVMVDSVAALVPEARVESEYNQQSIGQHARLMSAGIQKILPVVRRTNTLLIFINQIRNKVGSYGNPQTTTGGEALPFYAGYRIEVIGSPNQKSRRLQDEGTGEVYGHRTTFRVIKNKRGAPYREAEVDLIYGIGYDTIGETLDLGVDLGLIDKGGAWLEYKGNKWQGRNAAKLALQKDEVLQQRIENEIRATIRGDVLRLPDVPEGEEEVSVDGQQPGEKRKGRSKSSAS